MQKKPIYETMTIERHVMAPREAAWEALLAIIEAQGYTTLGDPPPHGAGSEVQMTIAGYDLLEATLSLEPPWRRVYRVDGFPLKSYQATIAIRDDGPECHVAWSVLAEALPDTPAAPTLEVVRAALTTALELVAAGAETGR